MHFTKQITLVSFVQIAIAAGGCRRIEPVDFMVDWAKASCSRAQRCEADESWFNESGGMDSCVDSLVDTDFTAELERDCVTIPEPSDARTCIRETRNQSCASDEPPESCSSVISSSCPDH